MSDKKRIVVVAESIDVEDSSGSKANVALILNLKDAGFDLEVYHYSRQEIQLPRITCVAIKERKFHPLYLLSRLQRRIQNRFKINLAQYLEPLFGFSFTFFNDTASISSGLKEIKDSQPDVVLTLSKGASFRPHYALLKIPEFRPQWLAYIHDPYPFHLYPAPYDWSEPGYLRRIKFFKQVSKTCKWAAFPSLRLKEWMIEHYPSFSEKSVVIPHQIRMVSEKVETPSYFDSEKFVLLHAGNLMKQRPPLGLLIGFCKFLERNPEAKKKSKLLLLGSASSHQEDLEKYRNRKEIFISDGYVAYKEVLQMQKEASVNIILESKAEHSPFLPGKFPHCIMARKPILVLGPKKSEVKRLLGEDYKYWSEVDDDERICELVQSLYQLWQEKSGGLSIRRRDLESYLSQDYLRKEITAIIERQ